MAEKEVGNAEIQYAIDNKDDDETKRISPGTALDSSIPMKRCFYDSGKLTPETLHNFILERV